MGLGGLFCFLSSVSKLLKGIDVATSEQQFASVTIPVLIEFSGVMCLLGVPGSARIDLIFTGAWEVGAQQGQLT